MNKLPQLLMVFVFLAGAGGRPAFAEPLPENQIKTAYVLNFIKFVDWPAGVVRGDGKVTLCVMGNDPLGGALGALDGRKAGGREIHILQLAKFGDDLTACHVLFIGGSEQRWLAAIIKSLGDSPVLTISDIENFAERGGVIGLLYQENRILFEVNLASAHMEKLRLPGQMLNLATNVFGR
jgi:hypothetical protein